MQRPAPDVEALAERFAPMSSPEVVFGLVGPVGTDLELVAKTLDEVLLDEVDYQASVLRLSQLLDSIPWLPAPLQGATIEKRYTHYMNAGNEFRRKMESPAAMADLAITCIREARADMMSRKPLRLRRAFILHSLKRKEEVERLREVYGAAFVVMGVYAPRQLRIKNLAARIAGSYYQPREREFLAVAEELVGRDERERKDPLGQNVEDTFPEADIFVDATDMQRLRAELKRFIRLLFGDPFHTPTRDEQGMFLAKTAALRSSALGRQVGSVVTTSQGDVLTIGTNEVPKGLGGLYWEGDSPDGRDFVQQHDVSDQHKRAVLGDTLTRLKEAGWLAPSLLQMDVPHLVREALGETQGAPAPLRGSRMMDIIEFMRPVHAEMAAVTEAARRGVALEGHSIYVTTFPCHECARHLIASGLRRVVYVDPYPKSMAAQLYSDSMVVEGEGPETGRTRFEPFLGIAPRRYFELFELRSERKRRDGAVLHWVGATATPKTPGDFGSYFGREIGVIGLFARQIRKIDDAARTNSK